jgi:hypothetical protein
MFFAVAILILGALTAGGFLFLSLRRWGIEEAQIEDRLRSPETHKVIYLVPEGDDPAVLRAALAQAGFVSAMDTGPDERLFVECTEAEDGRVREIIEHAGQPGYR